MARAALDLGFYISSGIVTFRNAEALRDGPGRSRATVCWWKPDASIPSVPHRGKPNLPQYVREVAEYLAVLARREL